jgi:predicted RNA-binding Zn-ribbon protein involved in translation (DUF1610 family)
METGGKEVLSLPCPDCGQSFASAIQMDPQTFEKIRLDSMLERCSSCGRASQFTKTNYYFRPG